ncbi:MAG: hypothetical protein KAJ63_04425, partial [Methyloprofundus sp.]|nr:hypothetical protein [Methyloprofundus sp.]
MKRILHSGLWLFSALLLVLVLLLALLVYSPKVNQWLLLQLTEKVAGLSVTDVDGLLLSEIHLYGLKYHMEQADISIESLSYRLDLSGLFAKQLEFDYLHLSGVNAVLLDSTQPVEQEPQAMTFVMPVILKVQDLAVNDVQIHQQNTDYIIKALKLNLHYQGQQIQLSQVFLDSDMFRLQGDAGLQLASGFPFIVDLTVIKPHPELGDIKAGIHLQGDSQKIYLQTDIQQPSAVHAQGWVDLSHASPQFDLACRWSLLQWPMQGIKQYASENAQLTLQGTVDDYLINLDTDVFAQDLISGALHLVGQGNAEQLTLNNLTLKALTGEVEAKGLLSWTDKIPSQIQLLAKNIQLDSFLAGYTGHFNLDTQLSGRLFDQPDIWLELNKLDGEILDKPLKAKAKIHYSAKQLLIEQLQANVGDNALTIQGIIGGHNALDFTLDAANLHELSSDLQGTAVAQGKLQGAMDKLVAQFELQSEGLKFQRQQLGRLNAVGRLSTEGEGKLDLDINARRLVLNGMKVDSFKFISSGQFAQHHFNASVASDQGNLELAMQGAWRAPANVWQGQIQQLKIKHSSAGQWQLIQAAPLEIKSTKLGSMQLQTDLCLTQRGSTGLVCL